VATLSQVHRAPGSLDAFFRLFEVPGYLRWLAANIASYKIEVCQRSLQCCTRALQVSVCSMYLDVHALVTHHNHWSLLNCRCSQSRAP
jgi:hypothetical protein